MINYTPTRHQPVTFGTRSVEFLAIPPLFRVILRYGDWEDMAAQREILVDLTSFIIGNLLKMTF